MAYGVDSDVSEKSKVLYESFEGGDDADPRIVDKGSGILLMVPQTIDLLYWMETHLPGKNGSCMGSVLLQSIHQVRPP